MYRKNWTPAEGAALFSWGTLTFFCASLVIGLFLGNDDSGVGLLIANAIVLLLLPVICFRYAKKHHVFFASATRIKQPLSWRSALLILLLSILALLAFLPIAYLFISFLANLGANFDLFASAPIDNTPMYFVSLICVCIVPALAEEVLFRGCVAQGLRPYGILLSSLLSGLFFMLMHANPAQTIHQFFLGVLLALVVYKTNSLWAGILLHFCNNFLAITVEFILYYLSPKSFLYSMLEILFMTPNTWINFVLVPVAIVAIFFVLRYIKPHRKAQTPDYESDYAEAYRLDISLYTFDWKEYERKISLNHPNAFQMYQNRYRIYENLCAKSFSKYYMSPKKALKYALFGIIFCSIEWILMLIVMFVGL